MFTFSIFRFQYSNAPHTHMHIMPTSFIASAISYTISFISVFPTSTRICTYAILFDATPPPIPERIYVPR